MKKLIIPFSVLALVGLMVGCGDLLEGPGIDTNPNVVPEEDISVGGLLTGAQVNLYGILTGPCNFFVSMWMQQMAGVAQHYEGYDRFNVTNDEFTAQWYDIYGGGGLFDLKKLQNKALAEGKYTYLGIAKMWEALLMSTAADLWGDIPYSQAAQPDAYPLPVYDKQLDVHNAILELIDSAISDFGKTSEAYEGDLVKLDFSYGGDKDKWIAAAHTLKARILLNWAEVDPGKYAEALAEAQQGIASDADNWKTRHSTTQGEQSLWWQFNAYRFGYVKAGDYMVELLKADNDPRLEVYFGKDDAGGYSGSKSGESNGTASFLNNDTFGSASWDMELVSWFENQFIIAECQYFLGDTSNPVEALSTLNDVIQPRLEAKWGLEAGSLPRYSGLTGAHALQAIMLEKYKAMFLNIQVWSDWRRTGFPIFESTYKDRRIPRRFLYSLDEVNTNPNIPIYTDPLYHRNENDPGNPDYSAWGLTVNP